MTLKSNQDTNQSSSAELRKAVHHLHAGGTYFQDNLLLPDDIFIASYPRSGNHFVRFIILSAIHYTKHQGFPDSFSGMTGIPDIHGGDLGLAATKPRIIKTHYPYDPRYRNVIHLVRDPRDLIISYFFFTSTKKQLFFENLSRPPGISEFSDLFIKGQVWPGDLRRHTASFQAAREDVNYLLIQYERLVNHPYDEITRLLEYLNIDMSEDAVGQLIEHTSFANMSRLHDPLSAREGGTPERREQMLRRGSTGGYKDVLSQDILRSIEQHFRDYLHDYGYLQK
jgi:hypothetical protein